MGYFEISEFTRERHQEMIQAAEKQARYSRLTPKRPTLFERFKSGWLELARSKPLRKLFN